MYERIFYVKSITWYYSNNNAFRVKTEALIIISDRHLGL